MEVKDAILHRLVKEPRQTGEIDVDYRDEHLPVDDILIKLTQEIVKIFNRVSNGYGRFHPDENIYTFPKLTKDYVVEEKDFVAFSKTTADLIAEKMKSSAFATSGYLFIIRFSAGDKDWLIAAMLKLRPGTAVKEDTKELMQSLALDVEHLHEAARVDINKWLADDQPYLSFVKKTSGKDDVTLYFRNALGCTEYTDSKHHTSQAISAIDDYLDSKDWPQDKKIKVRQRVYDYFKLKTEAKEPANLTSLSSLVNDQEPDDFKTHVKEGEYGVNETFDPHPRTYKRYKRVTGKLGTISLGFDIADVTNGRITYDQLTGNIIISGAKESPVAKAIRDNQNDDSD